MKIFRKKQKQKQELLETVSGGKEKGLMEFVTTAVINFLQKNLPWIMSFPLPGEAGL